MRAAIYARYSSDLQNPRSTADQVALAREHAGRQGWTVVDEFTDAAISGASTMNRPGLHDLMRAAESRSFDVVVTESLDRLSRDLEDIAGLYKRLAFWRVNIVTLADGQVGTMHVALRGMFAQMFLADLAQKTRRGFIGRVNAGRIPGGRCYGYSIVKGEERGLRTINDSEADIVRRIFHEYAAGVSPMATVRALNAEGVRGPAGSRWTIKTLLGSTKRRNGLLNNDLYAGRYIYNRQTFLKDPSTGKRLCRLNPRDQWVVKDLPELAIVDADVWQAVQERRSKFRRQHPGRTRRPKHLLSGLLTCGSCGGNMIATAVRKSTYFVCSVRVKRGGCDNRRTVPAKEIERRVLEGLKRLLLSPDAIESAVNTYRQERSRLAAENAKQRDSIERELAEVKRKLDRAVEAVGLSGDLPPIVRLVADLEERRRALEARLPTSDQEVVTLHPHAGKRYRDIVENMEQALKGNAVEAARAISLIRSLISEIRVLPTDGRAPVGLDVRGNLAALLGNAGPHGAPPDATINPLAVAHFSA